MWRRRRDSPAISRGRSVAPVAVGENRPCGGSTPRPCAPTRCTLHPTGVVSFVTSVPGWPASGSESRPALLEASIKLSFPISAARQRIGKARQDRGFRVFSLSDHLVTGAITTRMVPALRAAYEVLPEPAARRCARGLRTGLQPARPNPRARRPTRSHPARDHPHRRLPAHTAAIVAALTAALGKSRSSEPPTANHPIMAARVQVQDQDQRAGEPDEDPKPRQAGDGAKEPPCLRRSRAN